MFFFFAVATWTAKVCSHFHRSAAALDVNLKQFSSPTRESSLISIWCARQTFSLLLLTSLRSENIYIFFLESSFRAGKLYLAFVGSFFLAPIKIANKIFISLHEGAKYCWPKDDAYVKCLNLSSQCANTAKKSKFSVPHQNSPSHYMLESVLELLMLSMFWWFAQ